MRAMLGLMVGAWVLVAGCGQASQGVAAAPPAPAVDLPAPEAPGPREAVFAGGCFWCVEAVFEQISGVENVVSGYAGGEAEKATYGRVSSGGTDHAEAVRVVYDPAVVSYGELLRVFFATHDPTQLNRQGPDVGRQYRSAVFYADDPQKRVAEAYIAQLEAAGVYDEPIVTTLEPLDAFYPAEAYHQDYVTKYPDDAYVRHYARPKIARTRALFPGRVRPADKAPPHASVAPSRARADTPDQENRRR